MTQKLQRSQDFQRVLALLGDRPLLSTAGLKGIALSIFLAIAHNSNKNNLLVVCADEEDAIGLWNDLSVLLGEEDVFYFPVSRASRKAFHRLKADAQGLRLHALNRLLSGRPAVFVAPVPVFLEKFPDLSLLQRRRLVLRQGQPLGRDELVSWLVDSGYERTDLVGGVGEFSVRGGIVDIFPFESEDPIRVEFFGDTVDSLRTFDVGQQRSKSPLQEVQLLPPMAGTESAGSGNLLDAFSPERDLLFLNQPERYERVVEDYLLAEPAALVEGLFENPEREDVLSARYASLKEKWAAFRRVEHLSVGQLRRVDVHFGMTEVGDFRGNLRLLRRRIGEFLQKDKPEREAVLLLEEEFEIERLQELFDEEEWNGRVKFGKGAFHSGFVYPAGGLMVVTERDLFGRVPRRRSWGRYRGGIPLSKLNALEPGDLMVHIDHGIGRYLGLEKITVGGAERECLKLQYRDGDLLYVHIEHLHRVSRYTGTEGMVPQLSKLGGKDWEKTKERTRKAVEKMAKDLLELYAIRKAQKGHAFSPDHLWQKELEASFVYDETPDQLRTIEEVKRDMESEQPMDRLICGDVGFGKTEVALRAAFKAVMDGKQVAILVPTTILAQQHYITFRERLANYPVVVELLSRFRSPKEQQEVVAGINSGRVDIVIGTHRLLSKDVEFKDLGLLIIDEEHRFGVRQKERLKEQFKLVDVLSLTATPIPRTLHLALTGSRDMSVINTPPKERLPVIAEVAPFDQKLIQQAILEELHRGGQVFVVHNRVRSIGAMARLVQRLVPSARVAVAHGQMPAHQLEKIMTDFLNRRYDCLVSTMIIESGLDMPNVNTLIVNRADKLGLAQLYQIKGRVGRSNRQAYAYFLVPPFKFLTPNALKRLQTIEEHIELGAGLQVAMKDLEIRGAGNLLGAEQSGYINAVGFDLYTRLLNEAVARLRAERFEEEIPAAEEEPLLDVMVDVDFDAYIPENYIPMDYERLRIYQLLSAAREQREIDSLEEELRDRFGPLPKPLRTLLQIARLRLLCAALGIQRLRIRRSELTAYFSDQFYGPERQELLQKVLRSIQQLLPDGLKFLQGKKFGFKFRLRQTGESSLRYTQEIFSRLAKLA
ncbi:MAG TPA: transcription-repair coupling factor, partial [Bacteroidetes bacterium]|nr:transcription-repair coupling factor [Bacteroidota bacterium]